MGQRRHGYRSTSDERATLEHVRQRLANHVTVCWVLDLLERRHAQPAGVFIRCSNVSFR